MTRAALPSGRETLADKAGKIMPSWHRFFIKLERILSGASATTSTGLTTNSDGELTIANDGVSNAMLRESLPLSVIGQPLNVTGNPQDISAGANDRVLQRTDDVLGFGYLKLASFTVATVPSASNNPRVLIYVSNETGGATVAFSDGTSWRRVQDRAVIS